MRLLLILIVFLAFVFVNPNVSLAHEGEKSSQDSPMMHQMMDLMHGNLKKHEDINCGELSDEWLIKQGEEMMEKMIGKEIHGKVEKAMTKKVHDDTNIMMGMWATGCVGSKTIKALMERYSIGQQVQLSAESKQKEQSTSKQKNQINWPITAFVLILGLVAGWISNTFFRKKT